MNFLRADPCFVAFAPIDLKLAEIYLRDGYDNGTNTPKTSAIEPVGETDIALTGMNSAVPDPTDTTGVSVKFGSDDTEYTVTARTLGAGTNEVQTIEIDDDCSGGTFTLTFEGQTTGAIAYNASAAVVEAELEALSTLGLGTATVSGSSPKWTVTFTGDKAATDVAIISGDGASLTGGDTTNVAVAETVAGVDNVNEIQTLTVTGTPTGGDTIISFKGESSAAIPFDATAAEIELYLEAMDSIPQDEATCAGGPWPGSAITVTFSGTLKGVQPLMTNVDSFTGGSSPELTITETTPGVDEVVEVQTISINDTVSGGTFTLTHSANTTAPILYSASAAEIEAALEAAPVSLAVAVTGGPGPATDWIVTFDAAGVQTAITGTGTNLTGGSATAVSVTEVTAGSSSNETTQIVVTPALTVATVVNGSVTFSGRKLEVKIGEGNLTYSETMNRDYILNRGNIDTVRNGDDEPMDVSLDFVWEFLSAVGGSAVPTIEEVLKKTGEATDWLTTSDDACEPYCIDVEVHYDPGCGGENNELIILPYFRYEKLDHNLSDSTVSCTGKCNITKATVARGS